MNFVTVSDLNRDIINNIYKIPQNIDIVAGVPRSGMLAASLIALYMNKPLTDLDSFARGRIYESGRTKNVQAKKAGDVKAALIVEDSSLSGNSITNAKRKLKSAARNVKCIYLAAYVVNEIKDSVDIYFRIIPRPRAFEWNIMHYPWLLEHACVDIDGVLCMDPLPEENDDGIRYKRFLRNARPKFIPTARLGWIVTSRLEKYREDTEYWLKKHGIRYDHLCMMDLESAEKRRKLGSHAEFKAEIYNKARGTICFIESEKKQAEKIRAITGKDVICLEDVSLYKADFRHRFSDNVKNGSIFLMSRIPRPVKRLLRKIKFIVKKSRG